MADQFVIDLERFAQKSEAVMTLAIRKIALDILTRVVMRTPVANPDLWKANEGKRRGDPGYVGGTHIGGRARGGWSVGVNIRPDGDTGRVDENGSPTITAAEADILRATLKDEIWLVNNVEYIVELEEGSSTQAPAGMLAITLREFSGIVKSAATSLNK